MLCKFVMQEQDNDNRLDFVHELW